MKKRTRQSLIAFGPVVALYLAAAAMIVATEFHWM
jgi:hypothetical protein